MCVRDETKTKDNIKENENVRNKVFFLKQRIFKKILFKYICFNNKYELSKKNEKKTHLYIYERCLTQESRESLG